MIPGLHGRRRGAAGALAAFLLAIPLFARQESPSRSSIVAEPREVRDLFDDASKDVEAGRAAAAVTLLQRAIDDHPNDLLLVQPPGTYHGAAAEAIRRIGELPPEGRAAYESAFGAVAARTLEDARERRDEAAIRAVSLRHFHTAAGAQATLFLGDLALERGDFRAAARAYARLVPPEGSARDAALDARLAACLAALGDREGLARLARDAGDAEAEVAGRRVRVADLAARPPSFRDASASPYPEAPGPDALRRPAWSFAFPDDATRESGAPETPFLKLTLVDAMSERPLGRPPFNLAPAVAEGTVLYGDSVRLFALDLFTGTLRWRFDGARDWRRLPRGEAREYRTALSPQTVHAPCAGAGVAVAALQVPLQRAADENQTFNSGQIEIRHIPPARRLFAFDLATGAPRWNHWNREAAELGAGAFHDRATVAGPPVTDGERVYALCVLYEGGVHVYACAFDLRTGATAWRTLLAFGQIQLNMFGRMLTEFEGSAPLLADGSLFVSTNLGAIARLDAVSGRIEWLTQYEQRALVRPRQIEHNPNRELPWANRPPALDGGRLYATPLDAEAFLACDASTGAPLGRFKREQLRLPGNESHLFVGVVEGRAYFLGQKLYARDLPDGPTGGRLPSGFESGPGTLVASPGVPYRIPAAALAGASIFVPADAGPVVIDRGTGKRVTFSREAAWPSGGGEERGGFVVANGVILSATPIGIHAYFDWDALLASLRERRPDSPELADGLRRRGESHLANGDVDEALQSLREAERILLAGAAPAESAPASAPHERIRRALRGDRAGAIYRLELAVADAEERRGAPAAARRALREAAASAPSPAERLHALLRLDASFSQAIPSGPDATEELRLLETLLRDFAADVREFPGTGSIPVGLRARLRLADRAAERGDAAAAVEELRIAAREHPRVELAGRPVDEALRERLLALIAGASPPARAQFETAARRALEDGRAAGDAASLDQVARDWPGTAAALEARFASIDAALAAPDAARAFAWLREALAEAATPDDRARALRALARGAKFLGNDSLVRAALARAAAIARANPSEPPPDDGDPVFDLAVPPPPPRVTHPGPGPRAEPLGEARYGNALGRFLRIAGDDPRDRGLLLVAAGREILAYRPEEMGIDKPLWSRAFGGDAGEGPLLPSAAFAAGRLLVLAGARLYGLDPDSGQDAFPPRPLDASAGGFAPIGASDGVVAVLVAGERGASLSAFDASRGLLLWSRAFPVGQVGGILVGEGEVFVFPSRGAGSALARVELLTGHDAGTIEIGDPPRTIDPSRAFAVAGGALLFANVVHRAGAGPALVAWRLRDGARLAIPAPPGLVLDALVVGPAGPLAVFGAAADSPRGTRGSVARIDAENGTITPFFDLSPGAILLGLTQVDAEGKGRAASDPPLVSLATDALLAVSREEGGTARLALHDAATGSPLWRKSGAQSPLGSPTKWPLPAPILGASTLALIERRTDPPAVALLARGDGSRLRTFPLPRGDREFEVAAFGDRLVVRDGVVLRLYGEPR